MKILITGYTTRMYGSTRLQGDYVTFSFLLEDILKEMGHEVHRKQVRLDEKIAYVYDFAFCGVAPLSSMTSVKVPETHHVMDEMTSRYAIYADDWSFCSFGNSVRYALNKWENYLRYKNFPYTETQLENLRENLENMVTMLNPGNNAPVLCPMFKWGDHEYLMRDNYRANLITVDPSAWVKFPSISVMPYRLRKKQWVMAALSDHSRWVKKQGLTFPVVYVGNKRKNGGIVLTETDTVKLFAESFGVLSVGYPSAGCGWWRSRYLNAMWAETLIYSDPLDAATMGESFQGPPLHFEYCWDLPDYDYLVKKQREWLEANLMTKEEVKTTIGRLIAK